MNIAQAKQIKLINLLNRLGYKPIHIKKNEYWYFSPFRSENEPSFKIENNLWYDFGIGKGGTIIDFVLLNNDLNIKTVQKALNYLDGFEDLEFIDHKNIKTEETTKQYIIEELKKRSLINYLKSRSLDLEISKKYISQIKYTVDGKEYFGIAFKSSKGFEVRNKYFKGCFGQKSTTFIKGEKLKEISIFEGFTDFLSILTIYKISKFKSDVLILNSLSLLDKQNFENYEKIYLFLDNDEAGEKAKKQLIAKFEGRIKDKSKIYAGYKDVNEFLVQEK